jgi:rhomboid family GlyGly-CTERM serine protease
MAAGWCILTTPHYYTSSRNGTTGKNAMKPLLNETGMISGVPVITLSLAAISLLLYWCGELTPVLQYDRHLIGDGEVWRIFTGHWVHWSFDHFLWCTVTLIALGYVCEEISPRGYLATLALASCAIPALLWKFESGMLFYRGLSGIASALFVFGAMLLMQKAFKRKDRLGFFFFVTAGAGYILKILYEFTSGLAIFVETTDIFSPVPLAHLAGGAVGLAVFFAIIFSSRSKAGKGITESFDVEKASS